MAKYSKTNEVSITWQNLITSEDFRPNTWGDLTPSKSSTSGCDWKQTYRISQKAPKQESSLQRASHHLGTDKFWIWAQSHWRITLCLSWWWFGDCWTNQILKESTVWGDHRGVWRRWGGGWHQGARCQSYLTWCNPAHFSAWVLVNQAWWRRGEHFQTGSGIAPVSRPLVSWRIIEFKAD